MSPSNPVPVQSQVKVPGVLEHEPVLHGVPVAHSFISEIEGYEFVLYMYMSI